MPVRSSAPARLRLAPKSSRSTLPIQFIPLCSLFVLHGEALDLGAHGCILQEATIKKTIIIICYLDLLCVFDPDCVGSE